jgi:hypothetical protein
MTIAIKDPAFYNGFDYFCPCCLSFFSISGDHSVGAIDYCPACGLNGLITDYRKLAEFCRENDLETAEYWEAFPPDEPLPYSRCAATPAQIRILFSIAAGCMRRREPVSIDGLCRQTGMAREVVQSAVNLGIVKHEYLAHGIVEHPGPRPVRGGRPGTPGGEPWAS